MAFTFAQFKVHEILPGCPFTRFGAQAVLPPGFCSLTSGGETNQGQPTADCRLRIADPIIRKARLLFIRNLQSAIRNPVVGL
jgi:hypothetical protein